MGNDRGTSPDPIPSRRGTRRFLVVGESRSALRLHESFQQLAPLNWEWLGVVADGSPGADLGTELGKTGELAEIVLRLRPTDLVVAVQCPGLDLCKTLLRQAGSELRVTHVRTLLEELTQRVPVLGDEEAWDTALAGLSRRSAWRSAAKRMLDLVAGSCAFLAFVLALFPVALGLMLERAGSVFVPDRRVGRLGRPFTLLRFRTTRSGPTGQKWPFVDAPAPTLTGALIQRFGIDRLPQSLAVLAGHLSLVGPRPAEVESQQRVEREIPVFLARTVVKPGLTGWEQLHRESRSVFDSLRQLEYDLYYVKHQSLGLDLRILARSVLVFLGLRGGGS